MRDSSADPVALLLDAQRRDEAEANRIVSAAVSAAEKASDTVTTDGDLADDDHSGDAAESVAAAIVSAISSAATNAALESAVGDVADTGAGGDTASADDVAVVHVNADPFADHSAGSSDPVDDGDDEIVDPSLLASTATAWSAPATPPPLPAGGDNSSGPPWRDDHPHSAPTSSSDIAGGDSEYGDDSEYSDDTDQELGTNTTDGTDSDADFVPGVSPLDETPWGAQPAGVELIRDADSADVSNAAGSAEASGLDSSLEPQPTPDPSLPAAPSERPTPTPTPLGRHEQGLRTAAAAVLQRLGRMKPVTKIMAAFTGLLAVVILTISMCASPKATSPTATPTATQTPPEPTSTAASSEADVDLFSEMYSISANCNPALSTDPRNAFREPDSDAWICARDENADSGSVVNIRFKRPVIITRIELVPGFDYDKSGTDQWTRHRVVTAMTWRAGGKLWPQQTTGSREPAIYQLPDVAASSMSGTITASERPKTDTSGRKGADLLQGTGKDAITPDEVDKTTAISSIKIYGHPAGSTQQDPKGIGP